MPLCVPLRRIFDKMNDERKEEEKNIYIYKRTKCCSLIAVDASGPSSKAHKSQVATIQPATSLFNLTSILYRFNKMHTLEMNKYLFFLIRFGSVLACSVNVCPIEITSFLFFLYYYSRFAVAAPTTGTSVTFYSRFFCFRSFSIIPCVQQTVIYSKFKTVIRIWKLNMRHTLINGYSFASTFLVWFFPSRPSLLYLALYLVQSLCSFAPGGSSHIQCVQCIHFGVIRNCEQFI